MDTRSNSATLIVLSQTSCHRNSHVCRESASFCSLNSYVLQCLFLGFEAYMQCIMLICIHSSFRDAIANSYGWFWRSILDKYKEFYGLGICQYGQRGCFWPLSVRICNRILDLHICANAYLWATSPVHSLNIIPLNTNIHFLNGPSIDQL